MIVLSAVAVAAFALGAGTMVLVDAKMLAHWRREVQVGNEIVEALETACRATLSDAWFKKVLRQFKAEIEKKGV